MGRESRRLRTREEAEAHLAENSFRTGVPRLIGVELERTTHDRKDPARELKLSELASALGGHSPTSVHPTSPHTHLPGGSVVTVEPGGQVEISVPPQESLVDLLHTTEQDDVALSGLLRNDGIILGAAGADAFRAPSRILRTPRYAAMERAFARIGPHGARMMCSTAAVQVCLDAGLENRLAQRWNAAHALGPVLIAVFGNSRRMGGRDTGWSSARMHAVLGTDPPRSMPSPLSADPRVEWARRVLDTPLLCVRRGHADWHTPPGMSFADWIGGGLRGVPTVDDLEYHASTMFTPVRPRGYLEVRYLDMQPGRQWIVPVTALAALFAEESTVDAVLELTDPVVNRWTRAAQAGLGDEALARVAAAVVDVACGAVERLGLPRSLTDAVVEELQRRLGPSGSHRRATEGA